MQKKKYRPLYSCITCEFRKTLATTPICTCADPPKKLPKGQIEVPKSCPRRKKGEIYG